MGGQYKTHLLGLVVQALYLLFQVHQFNMRLVVAVAVLTILD
jgi:hypothetical protein